MKHPLVVNSMCLLLLTFSSAFGAGMDDSADGRSSKTPGGSQATGSRIVPASEIAKYSDHRPSAKYRLEAKDHGVVFRHGAGPCRCDVLGARDVWVYESNGTTWHMFYLGTPNVSPQPDLVPSFPYLTMKAKSNSPAGPWIKEPEVVPFRTKRGTYYQETASPGQVVRQGEEYLMFFSASMKRTLGIARTRDLNGRWSIDPAPIVPPEEQIENSSLYFELANGTWFLFTNHIGLEGQEYTDAVWVYWTKDLNRWNAEHKAVVLDGKNCTWSRKCIGLPSVVKMRNRLAILYDAPGGDSKSHMRRDVGLAWLELPLLLPANESTSQD